MAKWRLVMFANGTPATEYSPQSDLEALGVVGGVYDDGFPVIFIDPNDPNDDWDQFIANMFDPTTGIITLMTLLPDPTDNSWGTNYAWDLNQVVGQA